MKKKTPIKQTIYTHCEIYLKYKRLQHTNAYTDVKILRMISDLTTLPVNIVTSIIEEEKLNESLCGEITYLEQNRSNLKNGRW